MAESFYMIVEEDCLRCGACSTLAPGIIAMGETAAYVARQPHDAAERMQADAALFNCPVLAIRKRSVGAP